MPPEGLVVQVVLFIANDSCLADPSLFHAVRTIAHGWQGKGLKAQYWGTSVERANEFFWLLFCPPARPSSHHAYDFPRCAVVPHKHTHTHTVWESYAHAAAIKEDPSYALFVQNRQALATAPVRDMHVRFTGSPRRTLEVPVTEVDIYRTLEAGAAETHEKVRRIAYRVESLQMRGFIALSWGVDIEDGTMGVNLNGWRSIEEHMRLGTLDAHKVFVKETEEIFKSFTELTIAHVHFKPHQV
ncbi:hypothetical protein BJV74DRAFT_626431 [Russula compacta]|nr:hypothetical protein BJV74DRAFT_626431 [Russula compacta]